MVSNVYLDGGDIAHSTVCVDGWWTVERFVFVLLFLFVCWCVVGVYFWQRRNFVVLRNHGMIPRTNLICDRNQPEYKTRIQINVASKGRKENTIKQEKIRVWEVFR